MCETVVYVVGSVKALVNITNYIYINTVRVVTLCKPMFNVISRDFSYPHLDSTSWLLPPTPAIFKPIPTSLTMSSHRNLTLPTRAASPANIHPPLFSRSPVMVFPHNHVRRWKHSNGDCAGYCSPVALLWHSGKGAWGRGFGVRGDQISSLLAKDRVVFMYALWQGGPLRLVLPRANFPCYYFDVKNRPDPTTERKWPIILVPNT